MGDTGIFDKGVFGASEMVIDGYLHLYKAGILKRVVYDDLPLQRLLNEGLIQHEVTARTIELLLERKAVHMQLSQDDFDYLVSPPRMNPILKEWGCGKQKDLKRGCCGNCWY